MVVFLEFSCFLYEPKDVSSLISGSSAFSKSSLYIWKFLVHVQLKRWEYQTTLPASRETCIQVKKQLLEPNVEQWTGSKLGKKYVKAVYCDPAY